MAKNKTKRIIAVLLLAAICALACIFCLAACTSGKPTEGLEYTLNDDGKSYTVTGLGSAVLGQSYIKTGVVPFTDGDLRIPPKHNGKPVTAIGNNAFYGCVNISSVTIPSSVTSIGEGAFNGCRFIGSIEIPSSVRSIGKRAFSNCRFLTSATIPSGVTEIGDETFDGCEELLKVNLPYSVNSIGKAAFRECGNLTSVTIPYGVTEIAENTFSRCDSLTEVKIPSSVTSIGEGAFEYCYSLKKIELPSSVKRVDYTAFFSCGQLEYNIFGNAKYLGNSENPYLILVEAVNKNITTVEIPSSVEFIVEWAFNGCNKLEYNSFGNALYLGNSENPYLVLIKAKRQSIESVTSHENTKIIYSWAFQNCRELINLTVSASVANIEDHAFYNCCVENISVDPENQAYLSAGNCLIDTAAKTLIFGCLNSVIPSDGSVEVIGNEAFIGSTNLTDIIIPDTVKIIGEEVFRHCGLKSIAIPSSVTKIGRYAFDNCSKLEGVYIPDAAVSIGECAFADCKNLTVLVIGNSVISIGDAAFYGCESLDSIRIPASVTSIGVGAFGRNISSVTVVNNNKVYHSAGNCIIETAAKKLIFGCNNSIIPSDGSVEVIGAGALGNCDRLKNITIPDSVTSIEGNAFASCSSITSVVIPDSVTSLGDSVFWQCSSLESVTIGSSVKTIGWYAFEYCSKLESITIPVSVTRIGDLAFYNCTRLKSILYGGTVAQWGRITRSNIYNGNTGKYTVYCTDGELSKSESSR